MNPAPSSTPAPDPDKRPIWPFLLAMSAIAGLAELAFIIVNLSALPVYLKFGLGLPKLVGYSLAVFYMAEAAGNSPMGALGDRLGRRRLMVSGALVSVCTCLITAAIRVPQGGGPLAWAAIGALLLLRLCDGFGAAALWPSLFASVSDRVAEHRQAQAMSILNITYLVGIAFGPYVGGIVNDTFGRDLHPSSPERYVPSFLVAACCFFTAAVIAYFAAPRRIRHPHHDGAEAHPEVLGEVGAAAQHTSTFSLDAIRKTIKHEPMLLLLGFITFCSVGLIGPYAKLYFMTRFDLSESAFGVLLLYPALLIAVLAVPLGRLADAWGKARSIHTGMGLCALSVVLILFIEREIAVVILGSLLGIGFVLAFPAYMAYIADLAGPRERGGMIGAVRMAQGVGALLGTALSPLLYGLDSRHLILFGSAAVLLTVGFLLSVLYVRERRAPAGNVAR